MDEHETVIVDVNYNLKSDVNSESIRISCSGMVLDGNEGLILTTGLLFGPLFHLKPELHEEQCFSTLKQFFNNNGEKLLLQRENEHETSFSSDTKLLNYIESLCQINVLIESRVIANSSKNHTGTGGKFNIDDNNFFKSLLSVPKAILGSRKREKTIKSLKLFHHKRDKVWLRTDASILAIWKCLDLDKVLDKILNQNTGWTMTDTAKKTPHDEEKVRTMLPFFSLLKLNLSKFHSESTFTKPRHHNSWKLLHRFDKTLAPYLMDVGLKRPTIGYGIDYVTKLLSNWSFKMVKDRNDKLNNLGLSQSALPNSEVELLSKINSKQEFCLSMHLAKIRHSINQLQEELGIGSPVQITSTPFGSLSPSVFLNSVSKGVLANVAGDNCILIMTDARCVPGCEGGAIFASKEPSSNPNEFGKPIGIVIAPFCWRQNEWVGLTFGCALKPLLKSLLEATDTHENDNTNSKDRINITSGSILHSIIPNDAISRVVNCTALIKVGSKWGSAVLVQMDATDERYLLTCRHVIHQECESNVVKAKFVYWTNNDKRSVSVEAKVIYSTPSGQVYDIAILEVDSRFSHLLPKGIYLSTTTPVEGDFVIAIGHGLFDEHANLPATVTLGNVSKILHRNGKQVLIQSTCAVHPGTSGGALVCAKTMQLFGIIVCNAKDALCGASYPHINLSIPVSIFGPVLNRYSINKDRSVFNALHDPDPVLNCYWQLGDDEIGQIYSKL